MKNLLAALQPIGRALMLPIAVLPVAALLLRLGQADLLDLPAVAAAGEAIFSNLGLLFAIGVAVGLARENHGAAGLASVVGYLVATQGAAALIAVPPETVAHLDAQARDLAAGAFRDRELAKMSVPVGLISGLIAGALYNRFSDIRLPAYLAFFGGRRFVPIASGFAGLLVAVCFGLGWPVLERGMDAASEAVLASDSIGLFAYGVLNRVLIVTGLHHILNNMAWFLLGDFEGVTGDLRRFFAGDPQAGAFMSGFFPVMMFGLPAACLAMYRAARTGRRKAVGGLLFSMALTSFLTGVTEPIEFTFMFLAPALYAIHALLTGLSMVGMDLLGVRLGFGFSAGLFDYVLNFTRATQPLLLVPFGVLYFLFYYALFRYFIVRFELPTPGREPGETAVAVEPARPGDAADAWIAALGGPRNLASIDACTTRLRLLVADQNAVDEEALKRAGARGVVRPAPNALQVVIGPMADQIATDIRARIKHEGDASVVGHRHPEAPSVEPAAQAPADPVVAARLLEALGGSRNLRQVGLASSRLCMSVRDGAGVNIDAIGKLGLRGVTRPGPNSVHVLIGPTAAAVHSALLAQLAL